MAKIEHLSHAPISEAVIELRFPVSTLIDVKNFEYFATEIKETYPIAQEITNEEIQVHFGQGGVESKNSKSSTVGYRLATKSGKYVCAVMNEKFSFSRVRPYENWETFIAEAMRVWAVFARVTKIEVIDRVAARFINEIEVPYPKSIQDILTVSVALAPGGYPITAFASSCIVSDMTNTHTAKLNIMSQAPSEKSETFRFVVDIDAFKFGNFDAKNSTEWLKILEGLRGFKNTLFFEVLTDNVIARLK